MSSLIDQGLTFHDAGDQARAEQCYLDALAADPANAVALKLLAVMAAERGQAADAVAYAEAAIAAKPEVAEYRHLLGRLQARQDDYPAAAAALEQALERSDPVPAAILCDLGLCYERLARWSDADRVLARALALAPANLHALHGAALSALATGRLADAKDLYERMIAVDPANGPAREGLAKLTGWMAG